MPAKKESFLLVSLNEDKAKELAQVITNNTCRDILDFLSDRESTESEIAKSLKVPISTVHYNLQQLIKGGLVVAEEFHYSKKGKEVLHYKLANKYIIIAPKSTWGLKEKLKKVLPLTGITLAAAIAVELASNLLSRGSSIFAAKSASIALEMTDEAPKMLRAVSEPIVQSMPATNLWQYAGMWFLIGGFFTIIAYLFIDWLKNK